MTLLALTRFSFWLRAVAMAALVSLTSLTTRAQEEAIAGTMPEDFLPGLRAILQNAVSNSPTTLQANIDLAIAEANKYSAYAVYWPSISTNAGYGKSSANATGQSGATTSSGLTYGGGISRDIFEWGADKISVDVGKLNAKISARNFDEAYRNLAVTLREQYLTLIEKKILLKSSRYQLELMKQQVDDVSEKAKSGMISINAVGPLKLNYSEMQLNYERSVTDYNFTKRVFMRLAGLEELPDDSIPYGIGKPVFNPELADALLTQFVDGGIQSTFQDDIYEMNIEQAKLNYRVVKYTLFPKFSASASYSVSNSTSVAGGVASISAVRSTFYGFGGGWTIFDGFRTHYQKQVSLAQRRSAERQKKNYEATTVDSATNLRALIGYSDRASESAQTRKDLDENGVNQLAEQVKLGVASQNTLDAQTSNFNSSSYTATVAICDYFSRWTEFVSTVGKDPALKNLPPRYVR